MYTNDTFTYAHAQPKPHTMTGPCLTIGILVINIKRHKVKKRIQKRTIRIHPRLDQ